jgi:hypothetical protein
MILVVFGSFAVHLEKENMPTKSIFSKFTYRVAIEVVWL